LSAPGADVESAGQNRRSGFGQALRWGVAALILWALFRRIPLEDAVAAARRANLLLVVPAAFAVVALRFWLDAATLSRLVTRFHAPLSAREARALYGLISLVNLINWGLGLAALAHLLRRTKGVRIVDSTGIALFAAWIDGTVKIGIGLGGFAVFRDDPRLRPLLLVVAALFFGHLLGLAFVMSGWPRARWARSLRALPALDTVARARPRDLAAVAPLRVLSVAAFVAFVWIGLHAFAVDPPLSHLLASMPVVLLLGNLPITPAGLGTQQAAMVYFYRSFGDEASILAFGVLVPLLFGAARLVLGGLYARHTSRL